MHIAQSEILVNVKAVRLVPLLFLFMVRTFLSDMCLFRVAISH